MRYYSIKITDPVTGAVIRPQAFASLNLPTSYTSFVNNRTLPGALNIELDVPVAPFASPRGSAFVRIWGIPLNEISQASDMNGKSIEVYAGMQAGLPLANPKQSGLIVQGTIQQAFGNWQGTDMTLDLQITTGQSFGSNTKNITIDWKAGTLLADEIRTTLATAYQNFPATINISPNLVLAHDESGFYGSLVQFAQYVKQVSTDIIGGTYQGVDIGLKEKTFTVVDGTTQTAPLQINFNDMIGQPTWLGPLEIHVPLVMRGDLELLGYIQMPKTQVSTSPASLSQYRNRSAQQGLFRINELRHVGNFRQADAASWVTNVTAFLVTPNGQ